MAISKKDLERTRENLKKLGLTAEEIEDVIKADMAIEAGEKLFELDAEQEKVVKKMRQADRKVVEKVNRERKIDGEKEAIISQIAAIFAPASSIVKPDREISMTLGANYTITLVKRRKVTEAVPAAPRPTDSKKRVDLEKEKIIAQIADLFGNDAVITNLEREISLMVGEAQYGITLVKHRK